MSPAPSPLSLDRRRLLVGSSALLLGGLGGLGGARAAAPLLTVGSRTLEVKGKAAKVFGITGPNGQPGLVAREGDRFAGEVVNATDGPLIMHWHGQVLAPYDQDRSRPGGGETPVGGRDVHDFPLTPGTHWMHSHQMTEQRLLAAPMVTIEKDAGDVQNVVVMLHDFAFRSPEEILAELGGGGSSHGAHGAAATPVQDPHAGHGAAQTPVPAPSGDHTGHGAPAPQSGAMSGMLTGPMNGHAMHGPGGMPGMGPGAMVGMMGAAPHANDVRYDAHLANDRSLDDPQVVQVDRGGRVRLRIINGATATAYFVDTGQLAAECVAVDGAPYRPLAGNRFPLAQGQRLDLVVTVPREGGAFPILAQVEADRALTGLVLATAGAEVKRLTDSAKDAAAHTDLSFDRQLVAARPLAARPVDRTFHLMLGEAPGYRWTLNGAIHGEHTPLEARVGERIEIMFMNPTSMMHPMHLHGHHFQVVGTRGGRFAGPMRDTVIVPPHTPVVIAVDLDKRGDWFLHCHHLYHMATGMMTELRVR
ncbi:MAG: multicopper oxidase domain-containing protein [Hyphomicrobiaceae bacterium]|nr:multicopper oxidase domain-containing protein [Hyphomicrobiaceae bacterium]